MLFNSTDFFQYFLLIYLVYLMLPYRGQNFLLLIASYLFYCAWDPRFPAILLVSTGIDYICGLSIDRTDDQRRRKALLWLSIVANMGILCLFKYYNFFADNLILLVSQFGLELDARYTNFILPVGISFYTFQSMSYTIDIYRKKISATDQFLEFALFVSFFPQLLAGPIETAKNLLPQMMRSRQITKEKIAQGAYLIFWGLFEKIVVADNIAPYVGQLVAAPPPFNGFTTLVVAFGAAVMIYCDFDGYSNIARGLGKLMGFEIVINFRFPYLAATPTEFWRRWHISLTEWFRDNLFFPLGGSRAGNLRTFRNVLITFFLVGLWHGANWTFILWGTFHGLLLVAYQVLAASKLKVLAPPRLIQIAIFFLIFVVSGYLFFAQSVEQAIAHWQATLFNFNFDPFFLATTGYIIVLLSLIPLAMQCLQAKYDDVLAICRLPRALRVSIYLILFYLMIFCSPQGSPADFIYFRF